MIELFYSYGGHGGPYPTVEAAREAARRLIAGSRTLAYVELRPYAKPGETGGPYGPPIETVRREQ